MHKYSCDNDRRDYVSAVTMLICIIVSYLISDTIAAYVANNDFFVKILIFIVIAGPFTLWTYLADGLSVLFLKVSGIRNCTGEYTGTLKSSYDSFERKYDVTVKIVHKFRNIEIRLDTSTSTSHSVTASLHQDGNRTKITYTYENEGSLEMDFNRHIGTGIITIEGQTIKGIYYTHPDRGTSGTFELIKRIGQ